MADSSNSAAGVARTRWLGLAHRLGISTDDAIGLGDSLIEAYTGPGRHHHDIGHVVEVLEAIGDLLGTPAPVDAELAAWFHDAVYDAKAGDDERASAVMAHAELTGVGVEHKLVERVASLVEATANHTCGPDDGVGAAFLDADLSVLGTDDARYDRYAQAVRQEYSHLDEPTWRTGRAAVLASLLERHPLFMSESGQRRWETRARANMARELEGLQ
ncbi:MAG: metal-dependent phosphohydrolase [Actinomycetia bacterium]|nr:metal-dependent phosphohydrolase [Actinomycetes bacterium]